jgi:hypothetical protein
MGVSIGVANLKAWLRRRGHQIASRGDSAQGHHQGEGQRSKCHDHEHPGYKSKVTVHESGAKSSPGTTLVSKERGWRLASPTPASGVHKPYLVGGSSAPPRTGPSSSSGLGGVGRAQQKKKSEKKRQTQKTGQRRRDKQQVIFSCGSVDCQIWSVDAQQLIIPCAPCDMTPPNLNRLILSLLLMADLAVGRVVPISIN